MEGRGVCWWREPEFYGVILVVLLGLFVRLDALSIRGEESHRFCIGVEMLETGEWIVPRVQGESTYFRPPLQNWLAGLAAWLRGVWDPWTVRLPGALALLLLCVLLYLYCRNFLSSLGAFSSAAAFATMIQVLELGRLGETEALFTALVASSLLVWHWGYTRGWPDRRTWMAAYFLAALGMLTKGSQAPVYLAASSGTFLVWTGQGRRIFTRAHLAGLATFAIAFGVWYMPYLLEMGPLAGWRILFGETMGVLGQPGFVRHLLTYPWQVLSCMLPWSLLLVAYASPSFRRTVGEARPMVVYLLSCLAATFPSCWFVTSVATRYWMPLYPCAAPLMGLVVQRFAEAAIDHPWGRTWKSLVVFVRLTMAVAAGAALVASSPMVSPNRFAQSLLQAGSYALALGLLACLTLLPRRLARERWLCVFAFAAFLALTTSIWYMTYLSGRSHDIVGAMTEMRQRVPADTALVSFDRVAHRFMFYYGRSIRRLPWPRSGNDPPEQGTFFCFSSTAPPELPFAWEKVAEIGCDRFRVARHETTVIVGRRLERTALYEHAEY
jgi:4-amino-4-deoxy-L-arabinose transferase-like glycosyltransferase